ncbi:MAG: hypothetical protein JRI23_32640 [Deltaproteobacteria bacterium]|jgi:tetratricopeptide (TPR) repeat protein|nr:hypothetical protein [Deltaproteobacteria bacterium]MBW2537000.1 hypothetical protein [Deltaproteobacteria bacterium]
MLQRDYLMRIIERAVAALARALGRRDEGELELALDQIGEAYDAVLKFDRQMLEVLDPSTLVAMLGEAQLVRMVARISVLEGEIREQADAPREARACFRRALALYGSVGLGDEPEDRDGAAKLAARFRRPQ